MTPATLLTAGALLWVGLLFAAAIYGERRPQAFARRWSFVYALSLAVYCTSWTFYGTVTQAMRHGWWVPPTFVGTIMLYVLGWPLLMRLVEDLTGPEIAERTGMTAGSVRVNLHRGMALLRAELGVS